VSTVASATELEGSSATNAIVWGGLACGVLDITAACLTWWIRRGTPPRTILQSVASGLLGANAFQGGWTTAALGLALHFVIAFGAATVFYVASRKLPFLIERAVLWGMTYGVAVHLFMDQVVLPLSAFRKGPFSLPSLAISLVVHMLCVGLPIALAVRHFAAKRA
jgi:uncharacterized membrane protein YagU involved in acid resistance